MSGPVSSAPLHRSVCQLTGEISRPSKFWDGLAAADARNAEVERLRAEVERLRVENADLRTHVEDLREAVTDCQARYRRLFAQYAVATAQRDSAKALLAGLGVSR